MSGVYEITLKYGVARYLSPKNKLVQEEILFILDYNHHPHLCRIIAVSGVFYINPSEVKFLKIIAGK